MKSLIHAISVLMTLIGLLLASQAKACPDLLIDSSTKSSKVLKPLGEDVFSMIQQVIDYETSEGIAENNQTGFHIHSVGGIPVRTRVVVVVYHGLLNSPAYTRWLAKRAFEMGANVINVNLAKHNHTPARDLNKLTDSHLWNQVQQMNRIAEKLGQQLVHYGHSAGGNSAIAGAMESPYSVGLGVYAPALQVTDKTWWSSYMVGRTFVTNTLINATSDDPRYLSAASGRAVDRFSNRLQNGKGVDGEYQRDFGLMIQLLSQFGGNIFWIDTKNDKTILDSVNEEVALQIPGVHYYKVPEELGLAHVNLADDPETMTPEARQLMQGYTRDMLENLKMLTEN